MALPQLLLDVAALGSAYALLAIGFVLILKATSAVNFSHGDLVVAGGFVAVALFERLPVRGIVLLPLVLVCMAALGLVIGVVAYLPIKRRPPESVFITTIAVGTILQNGATLSFGPEPQAGPALFGSSIFAFQGLVLRVQDVAIISVSVLLVGGLYCLFTLSQLGRRMRATAQDREMAAAIGIPVDAMIAGTFAVGAALAGAAGMLLSNRYFVTPSDGAAYMLKAYMAVGLGGWGSVPGAFAGAMVIAGFEVLYPSLPLVLPALGRLPGANVLFSQTTATLALDAAMLTILVVRPRGLFGEAVSQRT